MSSLIRPCSFGRCFLETETLRLLIREGKSDDIYDLFEARNSDFVLRYNGMEKATPESWRSEVLYGLNLYFIEEKKLKRAIGVIQLNEDSLRYQADTVELAYWIDPSFAQNGYMTEALSAFMAKLFCKKNIKGITARTFTENSASIQLLEKLGFKREGHLRKAVRGYDGMIYDDYLYFKERM